MPSLSAKRIVLTTFGSFGDLHPYLALALELKARGHDPVIATCDAYRARIEALGIGFHSTRPQVPPVDDPQTLVILERMMDAKRGAEYMLRDFLLPAVRGAYEDLRLAVRGADLLVTHPITFAGPLVAQTTGIPWAATVLAPLSLWSNHEPPVLANLAWFHPLAKRGGPAVTRLLRKLIDVISNPWMRPLYDLRRELGLPRGAHPVFEGQFSPRLNLALFSPVLGAPQPDWPPHTHVTGFPFYDGHDHAAMPRDLARFVDAGEPPLVFTLGSAAVHVAGDFYRESAEAARLLGRRAVLLTGTDAQKPDTLPDDVVAFPYAPFSALFPHAAAIVHQGGVGTTGQALRAGRPTLIVPFSHDQPDNAARTVRLGTGRMIERGSYRAPHVATELAALLDDPDCASRAHAVGGRVGAENGTARAVDLLATLLQ
ncbi:MAG TPA: nucleotide disphospho-sugar-binding domain-containing protein [Pseudomonadales bacterium]